MTWVDGVVVGVVLISGLLGLMRGFVREVLGVGAWVGAGVAAVVGFPHLAPHLRGFIPGEWADYAAIVIIALVVLFILSMLAAAVGRAVQGSGASGVDRTLGMVFGLARGVLLLVAAYVAGGLLMTTDRWPDAVRDARSMPYIADATQMVIDLLPPDLRPRLGPPPARVTPTSADLLRAPTRPGG